MQTGRPKANGDALVLPLGWCSGLSEFCLSRFLKANTTGMSGNQDRGHVRAIQRALSPQSVSAKVSQSPGVSATLCALGLVKAMEGKAGLAAESTDMPRSSVGCEPGFPGLAEFSPPGQGKSQESLITKLRRQVPGPRDTSHLPCLLRSTPTHFPAWPHRELCPTWLSLGTVFCVTVNLASVQG